MTTYGSISAPSSIEDGSSSSLVGHVLASRLTTFVDIVLRGALFIDFIRVTILRTVANSPFRLWLGGGGSVNDLFWLDKCFTFFELLRARVSEAIRLPLKEEPAARRHIGTRRRVDGNGSGAEASSKTVKVDVPYENEYHMLVLFP
jgi:hypothetical protein